MPHPHGLIGWVDLMTNDVPAARAFYEELFDWTSTDMPTGMGVDYTQFFRDGALVAGMGPQPGALTALGVPSTWNSYVVVDDVDTVLAATARAGGSVVMPGIDVLTQGRMGMVADPSGAVIGLWQAREHQGAELFNAPGALTWNELQTRDLDAATPFYAEVFGWRWEPMADSPMPYLVAHLDAKTGDDTSNGGAMAMNDGIPQEVPSFWLSYFAVADAAAAHARGVALGGTSMFEPMAMGMGTFAGLTDPTGASFAVASFG